jgi:hypothetical protein
MVREYQAGVVHHPPLDFDNDFDAHPAIESLYVSAVE